MVRLTINLGIVGIIMWMVYFCSLLFTLFFLNIQGAFYVSNLYYKAIGKLVLHGNCEKVFLSAWWDRKVIINWELHMRPNHNADW